MRSPPWFCLSFSLFFPGSSQARSSGLSGNLPCDIWPPVLRQKVKKGGPAWKCRKTAQHTTSSSCSSSSTSPASLWVMSLGLAAPVRRPRTHNWRRRGRRSAHLHWGQSSKTPKVLRTKRFSPGWRSPDTQMRKAAGELQVCVTRRAKGPFHFWPPQRDISLCFCSEIQKDNEKIWSGWLANKPL